VDLFWDINDQMNQRAILCGHPSRLAGLAMSSDQTFQLKSLARKLSAFAVLVAALIGSVAPDAYGQTKKKFSEGEITTALSYKAKQKEVDYDFKVNGRPSADVVKKTQMQSSAELFGKTGYVLADSTNRVIRVDGHRLRFRAERVSLDGIGWNALGHRSQSRR